MTLLQRKVIAELLRTFLIMLVAACIVLVTISVFTDIDTLIAVGLLKSLLYLCVGMLPFAMPASLLLATCAVFGQLSGRQEVTAIKAAGIGVWTLIWPSLLLGITFSVVYFLLADQVIPWAKAGMGQQMAGVASKNLLEVLRDKHQFIGDGHFIGVESAQGHELIKPEFRYMASGRMKFSIEAESAQLEFPQARQEIILHLRRAHIVVAGKAPEFHDAIQVAYPLPWKNPRLRPSSMTCRELRDRLIVDLPADAADRQSTALELSGESLRLLTELYSRYAMSVSCFLFMAVGMPCALLQSRWPLIANFLVCFLPIVLVYYPLELMMRSFSLSGNIHPAIAMWPANGLLFVLGGALILTVLRQ